MKTFKLLAIISILTTAASAQTPGFFLSLGNGIVFLKNEPITDTSPDGKIVHSGNAWNSVPIVRFEAGYQFTEHVDLALQITKYYDADIMGVRFDTNRRYALVPSYTFALGKRIRIHASTGIVCSISHSREDGPIEKHPEVTKRSWDYLTSLTLEVVFNRYLSAGLRGAYAPYEISLPPVIMNSGSVKPSRSVNLDAYELGLTFTYRP